MEPEWSWFYVNGTDLHVHWIKRGLIDEQNIRYPSVQWENWFVKDAVFFES